MRRSPAIVVTLASLFLASAARGQEPWTALPPLPSNGQPATTAQATSSASPMVAVTPADASVDCGTAVADSRCQSMQLTPPMIARRPKRTSWYGWQILIADGAALGMLVGAGAAHNNADPVLALSGVTYALGGPIVHWAHLHGGMGVASLGLRLGLPVGLGFLGVALGLAIDGGKRGFESASLVGGALGFVIGFPTAIALDAAVLAREDVEDEAPDAQTKAKLQRPSFEVRPDVQTSRTGAQLGVRGTF
jgi:hypothetical protein